MALLGFTIYIMGASLQLLQIPAILWGFLEIVGGTMLVLGVLLMLLRQRRTLDCRARTLSNWSCLEWLAPGKASEPLELGEVKAVLIDRASDAFKDDKPLVIVSDVDSVWIFDKDWDRCLLDSFPNKPFEARRLAEKACRLLGVEYRDKTRRPPDIRKYSELDESLGRRYLRKAQPLPQLQEPPNLCFRCLESPVGLDIRIPKGNLVDFWRPFLWGLGIFLAMCGCFVLFLEEDGQPLLFYLLVVAIFLTLQWVCAAWPASRLTESLFLSRRSLKVESTLYGNHEIPLEELDDLFLRDFRENQIYRTFRPERYFPVGCLCARSSRVQACFGGSLDGANLNYLRALLVNRIVEYTRETEGQDRVGPEPAEASEAADRCQA